MVELWNSFDRQCQIFPCHTLGCAFWSIVVDPYLVPSGGMSQISIAFVMTVVQYALADCQTLVLVFSCELFLYPSCTNFVKPKSVLDDFMSRTMTDVPLHRWPPIDYPESWHRLVQCFPLVDMDGRPGQGHYPKWTCPIHTSNIPSTKSHIHNLPYTDLTFHAPTLVSTFFCWGRLSKESVQARGFLWIFVTTLCCTVRSC
jgi:hypothetical protein